MAVVRTSPRRVARRTDLDDINTLVNRFFGSTMSSSPVSGQWVPAVNVRETADGLVLSAELPGMTDDDVKIDFENNVLTIRGEKQDETQEGEEGDRFHIWERRYGSFQRSFTLPRSVDASKIEATFDHGVLRVSLPKAAEAKSRRIEIQGT